MSRMVTSAMAAMARSSPHSPGLPIPSQYASIEISASHGWKTCLLSKMCCTALLLSCTWSPQLPTAVAIALNMQFPSGGTCLMLPPEIALSSRALCSIHGKIDLSRCSFGGVRLSRFPPPRRVEVPLPGTVTSEREVSGSPSVLVCPLWLRGAGQQRCRRGGAYGFSPSPVRSVLRRALPCAPLQRSASSPAF